MEERRRGEERRRLDEDRRREALRLSENHARERALLEKKRRDEEEASKNRDRWAHRSEMQNNNSMRSSADVSLPISSSHAPSRMVISAASDSIPPPNRINTNTEQVGSFVPPSDPTPTVMVAANMQGNRRKISCESCGGEHKSAVCQERDPWDYVAPSFGSEEFDQNFFSIPVPDEETRTQTKCFMLISQWSKEMLIVAILSMNSMCGLIPCTSTGVFLLRRFLPLNFVPGSRMQSPLKSWLTLESFS
jgi:hypothetical protein